MTAKAKAKPAAAKKAPAKKTAAPVAAKAPRKPKAPKAEVAARTTSEGVAATWQDPAIAAKRKERTAVKVGGETYASVAKAFDALGLDLKGHVKLRMELKSSDNGKATHTDADGVKRTFVVTQLN